MAERAGDIEPARLALRVAGLTLAVDPPAGARMRLSEAAARFRVPPSLTAPDCALAVSFDELSRHAAAAAPVFDSGGLWKLYRRGEGWELALCSRALGPHPYRVAQFDADFARGQLRVHRAPGAPAGDLYPLEYPLDEWIVIQLLGQGRGVELHGCGVVDGGGVGRLFIGQSGAGKSTLARLWEQRGRAICLSDDRIIVRRVNGQHRMYGTPWHGEAGRSAAAEAKLEALYFLKQAPANSMRAVPPGEAAARLFACSFPPFFSSRALEFSLSFLAALVQSVPCFELSFTPDARVMELLERDV